MNKNRHRIIFNAARGQRMVVAENASSVGAGNTSGATSGGAGAAQSLGDLDIRKPNPLRHLALHPVTLSIALALTMGFVFVTTARAQIVADPGAPGNQRPTVLQTANGVPQVNIQTPSAAGVSRNTYRQFDVQSNGAILNNSRTNTGTQLGGHIAGNPWLATGEARVILNEVNSSNPSHLNGYVEVAGGRAEVIIANPAGIQVNGGGFINASGVTLTTGTAVMNSGHLDAFRVQGGSVKIEGLGLDTRTADYTTILTRAMQVNAGLWAKDLTVVTGTNEVKALASGDANQATKIAGSGSEPVPTFMLDVGALGGMYAGKIFLVGTEAGVGVNNRGALTAQEGTWVLQSDGSLVNTGKLQAKGDLSIQVTGTISNTGDGSAASALISSQGNVAITTGASLSNTAQAQIAASGTATLSAVGALDNTAGVLGADGAVQITAAGINNTQGTIASTLATLHLSTGVQSISNLQGRLEAGQDLTVTSGALNNDVGLIQSLSALNITATGDLENRKGSLVAGGAMHVSARDIDNTEGTITAHQGAVITSDALNNQQGVIQAVNALDVRASGNFNNTEGTLVSGGHALITAVDIDNTLGTLASDQNLTIDSAALNNDRGSVQALQTLDINTSGRALTNTQGLLVAGGSMDIEAGAIDNTLGTVAAQVDATLVSTALNNNKGLIQAVGTLDINTQGHALTNTNAAGHGTGANAGAGGIVAGTAVILTTGVMDNTDGAVLSSGTLKATTGALTNLRGRMQAVGTASIDTQGKKLDNTAGRIASQASLILKTGELLNAAQADQGGLIGSNGNLTIQAGATSNGAAGSGKSNIWSAQTTSITATSFTNAGVLSGADVSLNTTSDVTNAAGASIESSGNLTITTTADIGNAGELIANQRLTLSAQDIVNTGKLEAAEHQLTASDTFTNAAGASIVASNSIGIAATTLNNQGLINANEAVDPAVPSLVHIQAITLNNTGAGAIFGDRIAIAATTVNNRPEAGSASSPVIAARQRLDLGVQTLNNEDGALVYSGGSMAIAGSLDATLSATGQAQNINNLSAEIEAIGDLRIATSTLTNERRNVSITQTTVLDQTSVLSMPSWWVNGNNRFFDTPIETTSNYSPNQFYLVNPVNIVSDTQLVTPDGNTVRRVEVKLDPTDSVYHAAAGGYAGNYGVRERITVGSASTVVLYARVRQDGVANPDQVAGASDPTTPYTASVFAWQRNSLSYSDAYGRCTTNCTMLVVEPGYTDPQSTIVRATHRNLTPTHPGLEVSRTAHQTVVEDRLIQDAGAAALIRSGANMRLDITSALNNRFADIQAGAVLDMQAGGAAVVNMGQTLKRTHSFLNTSHTAGQGSFDWTNPDISEVIGQVGGALSGAQQLSITAKSLTNTDLARTTAQPTAGLGFLGVSLPTASAPVTVPTNVLFQPASPGSNHLIQGAPGFSGYRPWLGSEYLIANLGADPNALQKRLGDGFYEQKLIREQVAQLTGRRFLNGYANDEAQFQALMDAGVTYAKAHQLIPGVALTAQQMAQLTTDLVWLVEREVVLPDGSTTKALVPQVYVRKVAEGDFAASGALLAGNTVNLQVEEDLVNAGGRIEGGVVVAQAGRDLSNIGGLMQARTELLASAGRNVTISSPTHTTSFSGAYVNQSRTELAGVGTMKVGNAQGAKLSIEAGGNVALQGASISNAGAGGSTAMKAGGDVQLQTVTVGSSDNTEVDARNYQRSSNSRELGTTVQGAGSISIQAGNDVVARAASVNAGDDLSVKAGNSITVEAGRAISESESSLYVQRRGLLSKKSTEERRSSASDVALGSSFSGGNVVMEAGQDIAIKGSSVNAHDLLLLDARRDVSITSEQNTESGSYFNESKKSGFSVSKAGIGYGKSNQNGSGNASSTTQAGSSVSGADVLIISGRDTRVGASTVVADDLLSIDAGRDVSIVSGVNSQTSEQASHSKSKGINLLPSGLTPSVTLLHSTRDNADGTSASTTAAASTVGSLGGDVAITAGQKYQQTGSDVLALAGDLDIQARQVEITEARETRSSTSQQSSKSTVLGATPRNALVDAINGAKSTVETAQATAQTGNSRVQALGAAATALSAYNTANQVAELVADPGKIASVTIDFSLGSNKSRSESTETVNSGRASSVAAAGDARITASGAASDSDILIRGSDVSAGKDARIKAEGDVRLESSQDRTTLHSTSSSSGASIGVGVSFGASNGITFNASANKARGNADGHDEIQRNTQIVAGKTARIESGADATLAGASVNANTVQAEVGGNLNIESRQDTSSFTSDQKSSGWGVSLCIPPFCYGASSVSASGGAQNIQSDFASVSEQSGLKAGDGGFQINVQGDTTLKGGAITSTDKAVQENKNQFATGGELTTSDIQNHARFEAEGYSVNVAVAVAGADAKTPEEKAKAPAAPAKNEGSAGIGEDSGEASSVTTAAISGVAGNKDARTGDAEAGIKPIFDKDRVQKEIDAQIKITAEFGKSAASAWGKYANKKFVDAVAAGDEEAAGCWAPDGGCRAGGHALIGGLAGGAGGAAGAGLSSAAAPHVQAFLVANGVPDDAAKAITQLSALGAGTAVGGAAGGAGGLNEASNNALLALPLLVESIAAGGALAARACLTSPACVNALRLGGATVVAKVASLVDPADLAKIPGFGTTSPLPPVGPTIKPAEIQKIYGTPPLNEPQELKAWLGQVLDGYPADEAAKWAEDFVSTLPASQQQSMSDFIMMSVQDNAVAGSRREREVTVDLQSQYPGGSVQNQQYLRDKDGNIVIDPNTGTARRLDHVVIVGGKVIEVVETTSLTADKRDQILHEQETRRAGGTFIRDRETGKLVEVSDVSRIERRP